MPRRISVTLTVLIVVTSLVACADTGGRLQRHRHVPSCPDGLILICESQQPPAKGGVEEIPEYDRCYCESVL